VSGEAVGTRAVLARKLQPGDVLADGAIVERVELSKGKRTMSTIRDDHGRSLGRSGWPIDADIVRVHVEGGEPCLPRRYWPRQKVEVRNG
jgi:hypothetical protein